MDLALENYPDNIQSRLERSRKCALSFPARLFIYHAAPQLWDPAKTQSKKDTAPEWHKILTPTDLSECNPFTCWWLACPEYSPLHPWRQIKSAAFFECYLTVGPISLPLSFQSISCLPILGAESNFRKRKGQLSSRGPDERRRLLDGEAELKSPQGRYQIFSFHDPLVPPFERHACLLQGAGCRRTYQRATGTAGRRAQRERCKARHGIDRFSGLGAAERPQSPGMVRIVEGGEAKLGGKVQRQWRRVL
jgi:hypothetical protein